MPEYRPGRCNIGASQRRGRRAAGVLGTTAALALVAYVAVADLPPAAYLGAFPFFFAGFLGLLQDRFRFCALFGAVGRYDVGAGVDRSPDAEAVRRDRRRALQLLAYAAVAAAVATGFVYLAATAL